MNVVSTSIFIGLLLCILQGAIFLRVWLSQRHRIAYLLFSISAFAMAGYAGVELRMMKAASAADYFFALQVGHVVAWISYVSFVLFIWYFLNASRAWMLWTGITLRTTALIVNFLVPQNINFTEITGIKQVEFLGETLSVAVGTRNPLMVIGHLGTLWILIYCVDTAITVWRKGDHNLASWIGGSSIIFIGGRMATTVMVLWGFVEIPLTVTPFFLGLLIAMGHKLTMDISRVDDLASELEKEREQARNVRTELEIAKETGHLGVWVREVGKEEIWASKEWRELFGFDANETLTFAKFLQRVHPDDQLMIGNKLESLSQGSGNYSTEYRIVLPNGDVRWISSRGRLETLDGQPNKIYGASADITETKNAESTIHSLGSKLIGAQEAERARLGRELHDDLSQRLALLSIELEKLHGKDAADIEERIDQLSQSIQVISSDVHRISHELHPAKLDQLGLSVALRGFCREIGEARRLNVELQCDELPRDISRDISLCAYRVVQEALQNVAKHSGAKSALTLVKLIGDNLQIEVIDDGKGFDTGNGHLKASLGLVSMRERLTTLGGHLEIESQVGKGTRITARIPISKSTVAAG